ncbi:MAG: hypothetical protein N2445_08175, partial [Acidobacteria bacterium]|nr:hypothetical protein [Acidobacteriota bacterium]
MKKEDKQIYTLTKKIKRGQKKLIPVEPSFVLQRKVASLVKDSEWRQQLWITSLMKRSEVKLAVKTPSFR